MARNNDDRNEDDRFLFLGEEELTRRGQRTKRIQDDDGELPEEAEIE